MTDVLIAAGALLNVVGIIPYILSVIKGDTKPRIVSWLTWSLLTGVACAASFADRQYASGFLTLSAVVVTASVVILGWKYGDRKFEPLDICCQAGAIVGLLLWHLFDSPAVAVLFSILIDFIGAIPTVKHSWQKPHEETYISFITASLSGLCATLAAHGWSITAIAYPLYILGMNAMFAAVILSRRKYAVPGEPAEFREL